MPSGPTTSTCTDTETETGGQWLPNPADTQCTDFTTTGTEIMLKDWLCYDCLTGLVKTVSTITTSTTCISLCTLATDSSTAAFVEQGTYH